MRPAHVDGQMFSFNSVHSLLTWITVQKVVQKSSLQSDSLLYEAGDKGERWTTVKKTKRNIKIVLNFESVREHCCPVYRLKVRDALRDLVWLLLIKYTHGGLACGNDTHEITGCSVCVSPLNTEHDSDSFSHTFCLHLWFIEVLLISQVWLFRHWHFIHYFL